MTDWSLRDVLSSLNDEVEQKLAIARTALAHPTTKGDASQLVWLDLLGRYLPQRYRVASAHIADSTGAFSEQIDVVVFDRQYSPFILEFNGQIVLPAESVYAVFEAKQAISAAHVAYAHKKIESVRKLHRTSIPIPHAGGTYPAKPLHHIIGGLLTLDSDWKPALGESLEAALRSASPRQSLDIGCVAAHGLFQRQPDGKYQLDALPKPASRFLFELIAVLQEVATVPMIDVRAYAAWLSRN